jgi:hypothetical protein
LDTLVIPNRGNRGSSIASVSLIATALCVSLVQRFSELNVIGAAVAPLIVFPDQDFLRWYHLDAIFIYHERVTQVSHYKQAIARYGVGRSVPGWLI